MKRFLITILVILGVVYYKNREINSIHEFYAVEDEQ